MSWVSCQLTVDGPVFAVSTFISKVRLHGRELNFNAHVPITPDMPPAGARVTLWGTPSNADDVSLEFLRDGTVRYRFSTQHAPPSAWLRAVATLHPKLTFLLDWGQGKPDAGGRTHYVRGNVVEDSHSSYGQFSLAAYGVIRRTCEGCTMPFETTDLSTMVCDDCEAGRCTHCGKLRSEPAHTPEGKCCTAPGRYEPTKPAT